MSIEEGPAVTLSASGQVELPEAVLRASGWTVGTQLTVEMTPQGLLLKPEPVFPETRLEDVFGCLAYSGEPKSLAEMEAGTAAEAERRHES
ncbi:MAG: AbrB/MazE/SpoVT family DNA-binding domain-containing protein [Rhodospirillaceae bacterium]|nr:AbrB/MazE/SpoVT family DNA-binding domain-containing protein [Rhodospirillaceae bacterium]